MEGDFKAQDTEMAYERLLMKQNQVQRLYNAEYLENRDNRRMRVHSKTMVRREL